MYGLQGLALLVGYGIKFQVILMGRVKQILDEGMTLESYLKEILENMKIHYVKTLNEVLDIALDGKLKKRRLQ